MANKERRGNREKRKPKSAEPKLKTVSTSTFASAQEKAKGGKK